MEMPKYRRGQIVEFREATGYITGTGKIFAIMIEDGDVCWTYRLVDVKGENIHMIQERKTDGTSVVNEDEIKKVIGYEGILHL